MKAVILKNAHEIAIEETAMPEMGPGDVLVKVAACGICGTDLHLYKNGSLNPNARIGHETAGTVAEIGNEVRGFQPGERVAILGRVPCGECHWCRRGRHHICPYRIDVRGGFSEYVVAKPQMLAHLPDEITFRQAAVLEPLAVSLHGIRLAGINARDGVLVTGAGPIGLFAATLLRNMGVRSLVVSEPCKARREAASRWADAVVDPTKEDVAEVAHEMLQPGVDAIIECSGNARAVEESFNIINFAGKILLLGACLENVNFNPATLLVE